MPSVAGTGTATTHGAFTSEADEIDVLQARLRHIQTRQEASATATAKGGVAMTEMPRMPMYGQPMMLTPEQQQSQLDWANFYILRRARWKRIFLAEWAASMVATFLPWLVIYNLSVNGAGMPVMLRGFFIAMSIGIGMFIAMGAWFKYSNAHINPLVTFALWWTKKVTFLDFWVYFFGQFFGAWTSFAMMVFTFWSVRSGMWNAIGFAPLITTSTGYLLDWCANTILMLVIGMMHINKDMFLDQTKNKEYHVGWVNMYISFAYFILVFACHGLTNSPLNPFLAFIPAIVSGTITSTSHQIYWIGPIAAGFLIFVLVLRNLVDWGVYGEPKDRHSYNALFTPLSRWFGSYSFGAAAQPMYMQQQPGMVYYPQTVSAGPGGQATSQYAYKSLNEGSGSTLFNSPN